MTSTQPNSNTPSPPRVVVRPTATPGTMAGFPPYAHVTTKGPPSVADAVTAGRDLRFRHKNNNKMLSVKRAPRLARSKGPKVTDVRMSRRAARAHGRCLQKHGAVLSGRIQRMSKPPGRAIIDMWRERADVLPASTIARLRTMLDADEPFNPDQAFQYFINLRRNTKNRGKRNNTQMDKNQLKGLLSMLTNKRFMWAQNATVAFAKGIQQRLKTPTHYELVDGMQKLSDIVLGEIYKCICMCSHRQPPLKQSTNAKSKFYTEMADKIAIWIDQILSESDERMLMMDFDEDEDLLYSESGYPGFNDNAGGKGGGGKGGGGMGGGGRLRRPANLPPEDKGAAFPLLLKTMRDNPNEMLYTHGKSKKNFGQGATDLESAKRLDVYHDDRNLSQAINSVLSKAVEKVTPPELKNKMADTVARCAKYLSQAAVDENERGPAFETIIKELKKHGDQDFDPANRHLKKDEDAADTLQEAHGLSNVTPDKSTVKKYEDLLHKAVDSGTPPEQKEEMTGAMKRAANYLSAFARDADERGPAFETIIRELKKHGEQDFDSANRHLKKDDDAAYALQEAHNLSKVTPDKSTVKKYEDLLHKAVDSGTPPEQKKEMAGAMKRAANYLSAFARDADDRGPAFETIIKELKKSGDQQFDPVNRHLKTDDDAAQALQEAHGISNVTPDKTTVKKYEDLLHKAVDPGTPSEQKEEMAGAMKRAANYLSAFARDADDRGPAFETIIKELKKNGDQQFDPVNRHLKTDDDAAQALQEAHGISTVTPDKTTVKKYEDLLHKAVDPGTPSEQKEEMDGAMKRAANYLSAFARDADDRGPAFEAMIKELKKHGDQQFDPANQYLKTDDDAAQALQEAHGISNVTPDKNTVKKYEDLLNKVVDSETPSDQKEEMAGATKRAANYLSAFARDGGEALKNLSEEQAKRDVGPAAQEKLRDSGVTAEQAANLSLKEKGQALAKMSPEESQKLMATMTPDEKKNMLAGMSKEDRNNMLAAMTPNEIKNLMAGMSEEEKRKYLADLSPEELKKVMAGMSDEENKRLMAGMTDEEKKKFLAPLSEADKNKLKGLEGKQAMAPEELKNVLNQMSDMSPKEKAMFLANMSPSDTKSVLAGMSDEEKKNFLTALSPEDKMKLLPGLSPDEIKNVIAGMSDAEKRQFVGEISAAEKNKLLSSMSPSEVKKLMAGMSDDEKRKFLAGLSPEEMKKVLAGMSPDEISRLMNNMTDGEKRKFLASLSDEDRKGLLAGMSDEETARLMTGMSDEEKRKMLAGMSVEQRKKAMAEMPEEEKARLIADMSDADKKKMLRSMSDEERRKYKAGLSEEERKALEDPTSDEARKILHKQLRAKGDKILHIEDQTALAHGQASEWITEPKPVEESVRDAEETARLAKHFERKLDALVRPVTPALLTEAMEDVIIDSGRTCAERFVTENHMANVRDGLIAEMQKHGNEILIEIDGAAETAFFAAQRLKRHSTADAKEPSNEVISHLTKKLNEIIRCRPMPRKMLKSIKEVVQVTAEYLARLVTKPDEKIEAYLTLLGEMEAAGETLLIDGNIPKSFKDAAAYLRQLTAYEDKFGRSDRRLQSAIEAELKILISNVSSNAYSPKAMSAVITESARLLVSYIVFQGERTEALDMLIDKINEMGDGVLLRHGNIYRTYQEAAGLLEGKNTDQLQVKNADYVVARKIEIKLNNLMEDENDTLMADVIHDTTMYLAVNLLNPHIVQVCKCMKNVFVQCEMWCEDMLQHVSRPCCSCSRHVSLAALKDLAPGERLSILPGSTRAWAPSGLQISLKDCPTYLKLKDDDIVYPSPPCPATKLAPYCGRNTAYLVHSTVYNKFSDKYSNLTQLACTVRSNLELQIDSTASLTISLTPVPTNSTFLDTESASHMSSSASPTSDDVSKQKMYWQSSTVMYASVGRDTMVQKRPEQTFLYDIDETFYVESIQNVHTQTDHNRNEQVHRHTNSQDMYDMRDQRDTNMRTNLLSNSEIHRDYNLQEHRVNSAKAYDVNNDPRHSYEYNNFLAPHDNNALALCETRTRCDVIATEQTEPNTNCVSNALAHGDTNTQAPIDINLHVHYANYQVEYDTEESCSVSNQSKIQIQVHHGNMPHNFKTCERVTSGPQARFVINSTKGRRAVTRHDIHSDTNAKLRRDINASKKVNRDFKAKAHEEVNAKALDISSKARRDIYSKARRDINAKARSIIIKQTLRDIKSKARRDGHSTALRDVHSSTHRNIHSHRDFHVPTRDVHLPTRDHHSPTRCTNHSLTRDDHSPTRDNHSSTRDDHLPTRDVHSPIRDVHSPTRDVHSPKRDNHSSTRDDHLPTRDDHSPIRDVHSPTRDVHSPTRDNHSSTRDVHLPTRDYHSPIRDVHSPTRDVHSPTRDNHSSTRDDHLPTRDNHSSTRDVHLPTLDNHLPTRCANHSLRRDVHSPTRDNHSPTRDVHSPTRDNHSPTRDVHLPTIDNNSPTRDVHSPARDNHSPTHCTDHSPTRDVLSSTHRGFHSSTLRDFHSPTRGVHSVTCNARSTTCGARSRYDVNQRGIHGVSENLGLLDVENGPDIRYSARAPIVGADQMLDRHAMMVSLMWNVHAWRDWIQDIINRGQTYRPQENVTQKEAEAEWADFQKRVTIEAQQWRQYNSFSKQLTMRVSSRHREQQMGSPTRATDKTQVYMECQKELVKIISMFKRWTLLLMLIIKEIDTLKPGTEIPLHVLRWMQFKKKVNQYAQDWSKYNSLLKSCWEYKYKHIMAEWIPAWKSSSPVWVVSACGAVPSCAVAAGLLNQEVTWVARTTHRHNVMPAGVVPSKHCCLVYADGAEYRYTKYQVMCNAEASWKAWGTGEMGPHAVRVAPGVFVGRILYQGSHLVGAVLAPHYRCHVVILDRPFAFNCYELLVTASEDKTL